MNGAYSRGFIVIVISCLMLASTSLAQGSTTEHQRCTTCHINESPQTENAQLITDLPVLCISCHSERVDKGEHVINVVPATTPHAELPLPGGVLGCITCHDPHSDTPGQLRISKNRICQGCHRL